MLDIYAISHTLATANDFFADFETWLGSPSHYTLFDGSRDSTPNRHMLADTVFAQVFFGLPTGTFLSIVAAMFAGGRIIIVI